MFTKFFTWLSGREAGTEEPLEVGGIFSKMSPEGLCGINPKTMSRDEIRRHLAGLYKRHNAAASSLDEGMREEAEMMLDAIVHCREKYVDGN